VAPLKTRHQRATSPRVRSAESCGLRSKESGEGLSSKALWMSEVSIIVGLNARRLVWVVDATERGNAGKWPARVAET
jgi:hypothetical protein